MGRTSGITRLGKIMMVVGIVPLLAGLFNLCLVSALLGGPLKVDRAT